MSVAGDADGLGYVQLSLVGLFVSALVTAQLTASKVLEFDVPVSLPVAGESLALPGGALAYALTYFASDCYSELYGRRDAQRLVNVAFVLNLVVLGLVWSTILAPPAPTSVDPTQFRTVLGASTNIVAGSLLAYLVSQNWDILVFHRIREYTDGDRLWLRNVVSTATSQAIDTVIFVTVAFLLLPRTVGLGPVVSFSVAAGLMIGQYVLKVLIAVADTPLVYGVVALTEDEPSTESHAVRTGN